MTLAPLLLAYVLGGAEPAKKLVVDLQVSPRIALLNFRPVLVRARLKITDPRQELYCPELLWIWGDGSVSSEQSDCDPVTPDYKDAVFSKTHIYKQSGDFEITVKVRTGKVTRTVVQTIQLR